MNAVAITPRQRDVLDAACAGLTAAQTAKRLHVAESTVWTVRAALTRRAGVASFTAAVYLYGRGDLH